MNYEKLIQKKEVQIGDNSYCISRIPAIEATEIYPSIAKYYSDYGLIGLTMFNLDLTKKILSYTAAYRNGEWVVLDLNSDINLALANQYDMKKLVMLMVKENWGFLMDGSLRELLDVPAEETASDS